MEFHFSIVFSHHHHHHHHQLSIYQTLLCNEFKFILKSSRWNLNKLRPHRPPMRQIHKPITFSIIDGR